MQRGGEVRSATELGIEGEEVDEATVLLEGEWIRLAVDWEGERAKAVRGLLL